MHTNTQLNTHTDTHFAQTCTNLNTVQLQLAITNASAYKDTHTHTDAEDTQKWIDDDVAKKKILLSCSSDG